MMPRHLHMIDDTLWIPRAVSSIDIWRSALRLPAQSCVWCTNTEGATAPSVYQECVGVAASVVQARQIVWLAQR
jgi:hypothetical protein